MSRFRSNMRGASLAECVLALFIFVVLAFALPVLDEQGYVDEGLAESPGPVMTAEAVEPVLVESATERHAALADADEEIEVAANHSRTFPLASLHVTGAQP